MEEKIALLQLADISIAVVIHISRKGLSSILLLLLLGTYADNGDEMNRICVLLYFFLIIIF